MNPQKEKIIAITSVVVIAAIVLVTYINMVYTIFQ